MVLVRRLLDRCCRQRPLLLDSRVDRRRGSRRRCRHRHAAAAAVVVHACVHACGIVNVGVVDEAAFRQLYRGRGGFVLPVTTSTFASAAATTFFAGGVFGAGRQSGAVTGVSADFEQDTVRDRVVLDVGCLCVLDRAAKTAIYSVTCLPFFS